jgi:hypothetical protein
MRLVLQKLRAWHAQNQQSDTLHNLVDLLVLLDLLLQTIIAHHPLALNYLLPVYLVDKLVQMLIQVPVKHPSPLQPAPLSSHDKSLARESPSSIGSLQTHMCLKYNV